jgi:hypothetical protein
MKKCLASLCAPILVLASGTAFAEKGDRAGWYIGGGIGNAAVATYKTGGTTYDYTDWTEDSFTPYVFHFKVGGTLAPKHLLGADIGIVMSFVSSGDSDSGDDSSSCCDDDWDYAASGNRRATGVRAANSELDASIVAMHIMAAYTYYPRAKGFFMRAGIGPASLTRELEGVTRVSSGHAELVGLGYSFWIGRRFNIGVNFDLELQTYTGGDDNVDSSQLANLFVSADWY